MKRLCLWMALLLSFVNAQSAYAVAITNGSFETGNFNGWVVNDIPSPHIALAVRANGYNSGFGFFSTTATQGNSVANHGFDGGGPGTIRLAQDITLPAQAQSLTFDYRVAWNMQDYGGSTAPRVFAVNIQPAGGGANLASTTILTAQPATKNLDTGPLNGIINLAAFANQSVRISFDCTIPQSFTGPGFLQLDNVALQAANTAPIANNQNVAVNEGTAANLTLGASDADNNTLTYTIVNAPTHGTVSGGTGASRTYTPAANYAGADSFTFKANDGQADSNIATVSITVNEVPSLVVDTTQNVSANDGLTSLREGIDYANSKAGDDTITFSSLFDTAQTINLNSPLPNLSTNITITGPGANLLTVNGVNKTFGILVAQSNANATLSGLTITNGATGVGNGSEGTVNVTNCTLTGNNTGISGFGTFNVTNSTVSGNTTDGIYVNRTANVTDCILSNNTRYGIYIEHSTSKATIANSTLSGNGQNGIGNAGTVTATNCILTGSPSALWNNAGRTATAINCTFSGNNYGFANNGGTATITGCTFNSTGNHRTGAWNNSGGTMTVENSTFTGNNSTVYGIENFGNVTVTGSTISRSVYEGIFSLAGNVTVSNSTIVDNGSPGIAAVHPLTVTNCTILRNVRYGIYHPAFYNGNPSGTATVKNSIVVDNTWGNLDGSFTGNANNITSGTAAQAGLGSAVLQSNGGPTKTIALTTRGTAVNAGNNAAASGLTTDQRGTGYPRQIGSKVDIGAYESNFVNESPVANNQNVATNEDTTANVTLTASDADNDALTYTVVSGPTKGTISGTAPNLTYTPNANYNGPDSFTFKANDGTVDSNTATVSITVNAVNDAPVVSDQSVSTPEDNSKTITITATDVENDTLSFNVVSGPAHGTLNLTSGTIGAAGLNVIYTPTANYNGPDSFTYTISDKGGLYFSGTGHYYEYVSASSITWTAAKNAAAARTLFGMTGYLVTITSQAENDFAMAKLGGAGWIGATDEGAEGVWKWATGPEAGDQFWQGNWTGSPVNGRYNNWLSQPLGLEPNNGGFSNEHYAHFLYNPGGPEHGYWNDWPNFNGTNIKGYVVEYGGLTGETSTIPTAKVNITVTPVNDAPTADDGTLSVIEDTAKAGTLTGTDVDSAITYSLVSNGTKGSVVITDASTGAYTYTPNANENGSDSFTFTTSDGALTSAPATVTVSIAAVNDVPVADAQSVTLDEDTATAIMLVATDADNNPLTYEVVASPTHGTLSGTGANLTYTPNADYNGSDSFTFKANDGTVDSNVAKVSITVKSVNDAPVAVNDSATTNEDSPVTLNVKANDTDVDGDTLKVTSTTNGTHGSVVINANGTVTYTPAANYNGPDSFTYTISDSNGGNGTATVTVTVNSVNDAPTAADQSVTTNEDVAKSITLGANDIDGDILTYAITQLPANGTLSVGGTDITEVGPITGNVVKYTPDANYPLGTMNDGSDSFTFVANDGTVESNEAEVSITITAVCDAPVVQGDSYSVDEDNTLSVDAPGVLGNDEELDGETLHAVKVTGPSHGTLTLNDNGSFIYKPAANYNGADSFSYKATDGFLESATVTVSLTVNAINDAPVAVDDAVTTDEDTAVITDVLLNDTDVENQTLNISAITQGTHGSVALNNDGTLTYTPNANYNGNDSFTYTVNDGSGGSDTASVTVTIAAINDAPLAVNDATTTEEDTAVTINAKANDTDVDGDTLRISQVTQGAHGAVVLNADGTVTYTPELNYNGQDTFTYKVNDRATGGLSSNAATVTVTITVVNDAPVAQDDTLSTDEDTAKSGTLVATDVDNSTLTYSIVTNGSKGTATITNAATGAYTYTPHSNANGSDSFTFKASDGNGGTSTGKITVTIAAINDQPILADVSATPGELDENNSVTLTGKFADVDSGDTHKISINWGDGSANTVLNSTTSPFTVTHLYRDDNPTNTASDVNTITVTLTDSSTATNNSDTATATIKVNNVAPVANLITGLPTAPIQSGTSAATVTATATFSDAGTQDTHTASWNWGDGATSIGSISEANGSGSVSGSHTYSKAGVYSITLTVKDDDTGLSNVVSYQFVVVYDPEDGFVTGGGWINSPLGAYKADTTLIGKATFGFNSMYKSGQSVPSGDTEFHFQAGNFKFKSTSYEWMVISGQKVRYRGVGTVNGAGSYGFELTAIDGGEGSSASPDRFRIKIWNKNQGNDVVYDNQMGAVDGADPSTNLGGGNIQIHKP